MREVVHAPDLNTTRLDKGEVPARTIGWTKNAWRVKQEATGIRSYTVTGLNNRMPDYYRHRTQDVSNNVIAVRIFALREGLSCVVSWPLPEPGVRVFSPTPERPEMPADALPYAQFLHDLSGLRVVIEMDPSIEWQPAWGELRDWADD